MSADPPPATDPALYAAMWIAEMWPVVRQYSQANEEKMARRRRRIQSRPERAA